MQDLNDPIEKMAEQFESFHSQQAMFLIDNRISVAKSVSDWDEVEKWHRVKLRIRRAQIAQDAVQQLVADRRERQDHSASSAAGR